MHKLNYNGLRISVYRQQCGEKGMQNLIRIEKNGCIAGYWQFFDNTKLRYKEK